MIMRNPTSLENKRILVTGGTTGIGRATVALPMPKRVPDRAASTG
jgi:FlaA1/EpsC-like NDP-sugar epimerase